MTPLNLVLAARLEQLMAKRPDLDTQTKLADRARRDASKVRAELSGISQSTVQRILKGKVHTSVDIVQLLAYVLGVAPHELLKPLEEESREPVRADEIRLLDLWRRCEQDTQDKVMTFLSVSVAAAEGALINASDRSSSAKDLPSEQRDLAKRLARSSSTLTKGVSQREPSRKRATKPAQRK